MPDIVSIQKQHNVCCLRTQQCAEPQSPGAAIIVSSFIAVYRNFRKLNNHSVDPSETLGRHHRSSERTTLLGVVAAVLLLRKEVIQPHLPVRLPCYDFVPIASPTFDHSPPYGLGHGLRVLPTFVT